MLDTHTMYVGDAFLSSELARQRHMEHKKQMQREKKQKQDSQQGTPLRDRLHNLLLDLILKKGGPNATRRHMDQALEAPPREYRRKPHS